MTSDILADRYASQRMRDIFDSRSKVKLMRQLWVIIAKAQKELGIDIPDEQISDLEKNIDNIDLERITEIERIKKHDVTANKQAFIEAAQNGDTKKTYRIHEACTSRDITDPVEQVQIKQALEYIRDKLVNCIVKVKEKAKKFVNIMTPGYTHFQIAQATTVGRRLAMHGEELLEVLEDVEYRLDNMKLRGIKGAVGTQADQLSLFKGDERKVEKLDDIIAKNLGFSGTYECIGQTYHRVFDYQVAADLAKVAIVGRRFATSVRLLQGLEEIEEPFEEEQVGSTAMAQKRNPKSSERESSIAYRVLGAAHELGEMAANQWLEGSVECSAIRRIDISGAFYATDAILELHMYIIDGLNVNDKIIERRINEYLPKIAVNTLMVAATNAGVDREYAHKKIRDLAMEATLNYRNGGKYDLLERIAKEEKLKLGVSRIDELMADQQQFIGRAKTQTYKFIAKADKIAEKYKSVLGMKSEVKV